MTTWTDQDIEKYFGSDTESSQPEEIEQFNQKFLTTYFSEDSNYLIKERFKNISVTLIRKTLRKITKLTRDFNIHRSPRWGKNKPIMVAGIEITNDIQKGKIDSVSNYPFFGLAAKNGTLILFTKYRNKSFLENFSFDGNEFLSINANPSTPEDDKNFVDLLIDLNEKMRIHKINEARHPTNISTPSQSRKITKDKLPVQSPERKIVNSIQINQILYGPPGTGKTYNTLIAALHALNFQSENNDRLQRSYNYLINNDLDDLENTERENFKKNFESHIKNGRIVFTTFHQSYAYEDFIEGIRVKSIDKQACYEIYNGTFKQLARKALFYKAAQLEDEAIDDSFENTADFYARTLDEDLKDWLNELDRTQEKYFKHSKHKDLIHKIIANDAEIQQFINKKSDDETPKFILIIDEINRGNISKILGELITLIEDSKRAGGSDRATVKLPSSRELFMVPDNLYIIGTMNTSDRSLATLDVALRRRFDFLEMMPQPDFLCGIEISGINLREWFFELNKNIQIARGREFTIGHAFFASLKEKEKPEIEDLANIMLRKILPLLDEYFFEDWEGIRRVLGDDRGNKSNSFIDYKEEGNYKLYSWNRKALTTPTAYTKLYQKSIATDNQADAEQ